MKWTTLFDGSAASFRAWKPPSFVGLQTHTGNISSRSIRNPSALSINRVEERGSQLFQAGDSRAGVESAVSPTNVRDFDGIAFAGWKVMLRAILVSTFALVLTSVVVGCGHHPVKVKETKGPDGSADWKQITCKRMDKRCFQAARAICPNGYVFTDGRPGLSSEKSDKGDKSDARAKTQTLPPQEQWSDNMYSKKPGKLLIRCTDHSIDI